MQDNWVELRSIVKDLYVCPEEPGLSPEQDKRLQFLIDKWDILNICLCYGFAMIDAF